MVSANELPVFLNVPFQSFWGLSRCVKSLDQSFREKDTEWNQNGTRVTERKTRNGTRVSERKWCLQCCWMLGYISGVAGKEMEGGIVMLLGMRGTEQSPVSSIVMAHVRSVCWHVPVLFWLVSAFEQRGRSCWPTSLFPF